MELYQVRAFVTVARVGNVTKAADALCVTQPAVTGQLKSLEQSLGVTLFDRGSGRLQLTKAGEMLLPQAEALLAASTELLGAAKRMQGDLRGRIEIGIPGESPDFMRLGPLTTELRRTLPLVELGTRSLPSGALLDHIKAGTLAAVFHVGIHPPGELEWQSLRSVSYRVAIPNQLRQEMELGGWRVLARLPWVDGTPDSHVHHFLRALFDQQGLAPNVAVQSADTASLDTFVRAGTGCALLREEVALPGVERGEWMVWGAAKVDARLFLATTADRASDPLVVALLSVLKGVWKP